MFFRPSFCANCGEKIERRDWGLLTSRRFCPVCESEFKGVDLIPRVIVASGVLIGVLGVGGFMKSGGNEPRLARIASQPLERPAAPASREQPPPNVVAPTPALQPPSVSTPAAQAKASTPSAEVARNSPQDAVYMCGAQTKKGTPCSRRVHGPVRCFQHTGMPAMLPQEKLKLS